MYVLQYIYKYDVTSGETHSLLLERGDFMNLLDNIKEMIQGILVANDVYLDDIEYVKEGNDFFLRIYIEKNEGSLDMDTCVTVSEAISALMDEKDPIKDEYYLEVSSPGAEKPLKTFEAVVKHVGSYVYAKFNNPTQGLDEVEGTILNVDDSKNIEIEYRLKNIKKKCTVNYDNIKFIRLAIKF